MLRKTAMSDCSPAVEPTLPLSSHCMNLECNTRTSSRAIPNIDKSSWEWKQFDDQHHISKNCSNFLYTCFSSALRFLVSLQYHDFFRHCSLSINWQWSCAAWNRPPCLINWKHTDSNSRNESDWISLTIRYLLRTIQRYNSRRNRIHVRFCTWIWQLFQDTISTHTRVSWESIQTANELLWCFSRPEWNQLWCHETRSRQDTKCGNIGKYIQELGQETDLLLISSS